MLWVLWDIVIPLLVTFLVGLLVGWLLWRWRRSRIDADGLSMLRRDRARYSADAERLQRSNADLSERLHAVNSRRSRSSDVESDLKWQLEQAHSRIRDIEHTAAQGAHHDGSSGLDVEAEIASRDRMIETLERSLQQFGESDTTGLQADIAIRNRKIEALEALLASHQLRSSDHR